MSSVIRQLRNYFTKKNIYPQTVEQAIYDSEGKRLDNKLANGIANPNLLINADFRNPVNQRGYDNVLRGQGYCIDRWEALFRDSSSLSSINFGDKGASLGIKATGRYTVLRQVIEFPESYAGRTFTLSLKAKTDNIGSVYATYGDSSVGEDRYITHIDSQDYKVYSMTFTLCSTPKNIFRVDTGAGELRIIDGNLHWIPLDNDSNVDIEWIKLEEGEIATPFRPRLYAEELALCQRYYQVHSTNSISDLDLRPSMSITPTKTAISGGYAYDAEL